MTSINFPKDPSLPKELILGGEDPKRWKVDIEKWSKEVSVSVEELLRRLRVDLTALGTVGGTPTTIEIGDSANAGSVGTPADAGHVHEVVAPSAPTTISFSDTAGAGSGLTPSRSDHRHGSMSAPTPSKCVLFAVDDVVGGGVTEYVMGALVSATETDVSIRVPFAGTLKNLYTRWVAVDNTLVTVTVMVNGAATSITTSNTGTGTINQADTTNTVSVLAGDSVSLEFVNGVGAGAKAIKASLELTPT